MADAGAVIDIGGECQQRKILPIHVVLQIEDAREARAGNLRFLPSAVAFLRG